MERERRWSADAARLPRLPAHHVLIEDRYLTGTRFRLRRMTDSANGACALKLAKKYESGDPTARPMVNAYLSETEYALFASLPGAMLVKRRYTLDGFSVDLFDGRHHGLVLVEREEADADALADLRPPPWVDREVTHEPDFQGGALAMLDAEGLAGLLRRGRR